MYKALAVITLLFSLPACDRAETQSSAQPAMVVPSVLVVNIDGMHCTACAASIAATVGNCEGIQSADVSFDEGQATFTGDDEESLQRAVQTARDMGYTVEPSKDES